MDTINKPVGKFDKTKTPSVDREHIEKVISGNTKVRRNNARKFADTFIAEDVSTVKSHLRDDVLVPGLKKLVVNLIKDGVDILFNGRVTRTDKQDRFAGDYFSYNKVSSNRNSRPAIATTRFSYDDIEFENRGEAEVVLDHMCREIRDYGVVTVAAMYEMVGRTAPFTANNYGWTDISTATVDRVYGGYIIRLPRAMPIER